jgi:hypothetical protein
MPSRTGPTAQQLADHQRRRVADAIAQRTVDHQGGVAAAVARQDQLSQLPTPTRQRTADHQRRIADAVAQHTTAAQQYQLSHQPPPTPTQPRTPNHLARIIAANAQRVRQEPHPCGTPDQRLRNLRRRQQVRTPQATERRRITPRHYLYTPYGIRVGPASAVNPGEEALVRLEHSLYTRGDGILQGAAPTGVAARREAGLIRVRDDAIRGGGKPRRKRSIKRRKKKRQTMIKECRTCGWRLVKRTRRARS